MEQNNSSNIIGYAREIPQNYLFSFFSLKYLAAIGFSKTRGKSVEYREEQLFNKILTTLHSTFSNFFVAFAIHEIDINCLMNSPVGFFPKNLIHQLQCCFYYERYLCGSRQLFIDKHSTDCRWFQWIRFISFCVTFLWLPSIISWVNNSQEYLPFTKNTQNSDFFLVSFLSSVMARSL